MRRTMKIADFLIKMRQLNLLDGKMYMKSQLLKYWDKINEQRIYEIA